MKKLNLFSILLLFVAGTHGQNLVPNASFEQYSSCPTDFSQTDKAIGWHSYNTCDYLSVCATSPNVQVPTNYFGYQFPATGTAYAGFITYAAGGEYHEFLYAQLLTPCTIGQKYYVSFKVNPADLSFCVFSNKIGAKFFKTLPSYIALNNTAQVFSNSIITDTANWSGIAGSFVADSSYQYVVFGNFFSDANTSVIDQNCGAPASYYFIDDVCVSADPLVCNSLVSVDLVSFDVVPNKKSILLSWRTAQESNNKGFEILRSFGNSKHFESIGFIQGKILSSAQSQYYFWDKGVFSNTTYYYRLKQIDLDNRYWYSVIKKVQTDYEPDIIFLTTPNPAQDVIELTFKKAVAQQMELRIIDNVGNELYRSRPRFVLSGEHVKVDVRKFPRGVYFIQCLTADFISTQKLILK